MIARNGIFKLLFHLVLVLGVLAGCGKKPEPPVVKDIIARPGELVQTGENASLTVDASGTNLSFKWTAARGQLSSESDPSVIYTAPSEPGPDPVSVTVSSQGGGSIVKNITLQITSPSTQPIDTPGTATETGSTVTCKGNSSAVLIELAWEAYDGNNNEKVLACADAVIQKWTGNADSQQAERVSQNICTLTPDPDNETAKNAYWQSYWAVNDIGTAWFLRGEAFYRLQNWKDAREAYKTVIDKYFCAHTWNPDGFFWSPSEAAQQKYDEIQG